MNVVEVPATWGAPDAVLRAVEDALTRAPPADLVLLPELALTGYVSPRGVFDPSPFAEPGDGPTAKGLERLARATGAVVVGPLVLAEEGRVYNVARGVGPDGRELFTYRKRHPWIPEAWATAGAARPPLVTIAGRKVTVCICFDVHFVAEDAPEELGAADVLLFPSAWVDEEDTRIPMLAGLARRFHTWVVAANWSAGVVIVPGQGRSCVVAPDGRVVAEARGANGIEIVPAVIGPG